MIRCPYYYYIASTLQLARYFVTFLLHTRTTLAQHSHSLKYSNSHSPQFRLLPKHSFVPRDGKRARNREIAAGAAAIRHCIDRIDVATN